MHCTVFNRGTRYLEYFFKIGWSQQRCQVITRPLYFGQGLQLINEIAIITRNFNDL